MNNNNMNDLNNNPVYGLELAIIKKDGSEKYWTTIFEGVFPSKKECRQKSAELSKNIDTTKYEVYEWMRWFRNIHEYEQKGKI